MSVSICLQEVDRQCSYVPLALVGYCLTRTGFFAPLWDQLELKMKACQHTPAQKVQDILVAIMAGCQSMVQVNTRLRPELMLAKAWQRRQFAEQASLSRLLDRFGEAEIAQLRAANTALLKQYSQLRNHDWRQLLVLDIDPTSLLSSKHAQGSRKGWVSGKRNQYCRHIIRFTLAGYHESLLSLAYPGNRHGYEWCKPALKQLLAAWPELADQAPNIIIRSDAEQGTDENMAYILWSNFQLLMKGYSGKRTHAWVKQTPATAWLSDPAGQARWIALAPKQLRLGRHLHSYLLRWPGSHQTLAHATLHTTLSLPPFQLWALYNQRTTTEIEIRSDKSGLALRLRRKHRLHAQEAWVILTDIAHNLLAWLHPWMLTGSSFSHFGPKRLVHQLLNIPGEISFENGRLKKVTLWQSHPHASEMRSCLEKLLKHFDLY